MASTEALIPSVLPSQFTDSLGIVKDDAQRVPISRMQPADPVTKICAVEAACGTHRPMVDGEHHGIALAQGHHVRSAGLLRVALRQQQFAALEVAPRLVEQEDRLEREDMIAVQVLVQAAIVIGLIPQ